MRSICLSLILLVAITASNAVKIPQCKCSAIEPCKNAYANSIMPCADQCKSFASAVGADYAKLRQCLVAKEPQLRKTMACVEASHGNACAKGNPLMVEKRYPETLKIAALSEINSMLVKNGIASQVKGLMSTGKKLFGCMRKCVDAKAGNCAKKLGCGLQLPADNVLVKNAKQCAIQSGFNTAGIRELCNCAAGAGVRGLAGVCNKLNVV
uniref:Uncharacterized protein n=1 Tax=Panagrolaimus sp. ES5 TaxID=591445 RepID=A0AC34FNS1_9BILA